MSHTSSASSQAMPEEGLPWLFFGQVLHARQRPAANAFRYAAFFLKFPLSQIDALGRAAPRWFGVNRWAPMSIRLSDYGDPNSTEAPRAWLTRILSDHGITDATGEAWLHTFPRVWGYVFNPVSFWFCERADGATRAVVVEVNNTFGERHCYVLANADGAPLVNGTLLTARKALHVSPFAPVEGGYQFRFLTAQRRGASHCVARIDYADNHGPLIATSVSGRAVTLNAANIRRALLRYPLFTFGVVARIHWQALRLWVKRVPFFRKPAPPVTFVSR